jgi:hypothetical protein
MDTVCTSILSTAGIFISVSKENMNRSATLLLKLIVSPIVAVATAASVSTHRLEAQTTDHLVFASTDGLTLRYQRLVAQELYKTPSDLGRVVVCPSFEGEFALSIYSTNRNSDLAVLALVRAKKNIWYAASHLDHDLRVNPHVPVKRVNATIKRRVAFEVAEAISHAIARTQPLAPTEAVRVDGTSILFFAPAHAKTKVRSAELDTAAEGELSEALRRLVNLLEKYCSSSDAARQQVSREIETQARLVGGIQ